MRVDASAPERKTRSFQTTGELRPGNGTSTFQRMFLGRLNEKYAALPDLNWRERVTLYPLGVLIIVLGIYPMPALQLIQRTLLSIIGLVQG